MKTEHFDVLVVGAGLSGIGAGAHLRRNCPGKTYVILEMREAMGGTWDLFRYPGIRSDSDMYTLGYAFKPWTNAKAIADGPAILGYIHETAREHDVERHVRYQHRAVRASWSSADAKWTVEAEHGPAKDVVRFTCSFLYMCSGYYSYEAGYMPDFPGLERFKGRLVHPQKWTPDIDYKGKRVIVIGSGATAVTLVPELAKEAAHVYMLQRSPSYIVSLPGQDRLANFLRRILPDKVAYFFARWKNVLRAQFFYWLARRYPKVMKGLVRAGLRQELGKNYDIRTHFKPPYEPWDQRLCLVPDADLFKSLREGRSEMVTDQVETFTENGIKLKSGRELEADLVISATGLNLVVLGGMQATIDGRAVEAPKTLSYKGMMVSDVPNFAYAVGYTNASWTLKCDLVTTYVCRLINYMDRHGYRQCTPRRNDPTITEEPLINFSSGYVQRAIDKFPKQGSKAPWKLHQNYARDLLGLKFGAVEDGAMEFSGDGATSAIPRSATG
jgi:monooxygenase